MQFCTQIGHTDSNGVQYERGLYGRWVDVASPCGGIYGLCLETQITIKIAEPLVLGDIAPQQ